MTPQERDVILGIFDRLKAAEGNHRDPEAEALIAERLKAQPYAPYVLAQQIYAQEQALNSLQQRIQELEAELQRAQTQKPQSGGFLSGIFGGQSAPAQPRPGGPWGQNPGYAAPPPQGYQAPAYAPQGYPQQAAAGPWGGAQPSQGGGFLASAATTALGVAGGVMIANALSNAFSHHGGAGQTLAGMDTSSIMPPQDATYIDPPDDNDYSSASNADYDDGGYDSSNDGGGFDSGTDV